MKSSVFSKIMISAVALLLATCAYAAGTSHRANLLVGDAVAVNGKQLPAGEYTVTWQGDGPTVDLHIARGNKEVATAQAKIVAIDKKPSNDETETLKSSDGTRELTAMRFAGKKYELDLVSSAAARGGEGVK